VAVAELLNARAWLGEESPGTRMPGRALTPGRSLPRTSDMSTAGSDRYKGRTRPGERSGHVHTVRSGQIGEAQRERVARQSLTRCSPHPPPPWPATEGPRDLIELRALSTDREVLRDGEGRVDGPSAFASTPNRGFDMPDCWRVLGGDQTEDTALCHRSSLGPWSSARPGARCPENWSALAHAWRSGA
jgi:hypothetical protein